MKLTCLCSWGALGFVLYMLLVAVITGYLIFWAAPVHGTTNIFVFIGICSLVGSLTVMSVKVRPPHADIWLHHSFMLLLCLLRNDQG